MKPGDIIKWYKKYNDKVVRSTDLLYSSIMQRWVPIGEESILVYIDDKTYVWMNSKGCFSAKINDDQIGTWTGDIMYGVCVQSTY